MSLGLTCSGAVACVGRGARGSARPLIMENSHKPASCSLRTPSARGTLHSGPSGLPRARVRSIQRQRILAAAVEAVDEVGFPRMTVAQVIAGAGVSRKTFYDIFADREDCFLAAFEHATTEAKVRARQAYDRQPGWREGTRRALARLLVLMDEEPRLAKVVLVESLAAGQRVRWRRLELLGELAEVIDLGRSVTDAAGEPAQLTGEGVAGAVAALLYARLLGPREEPLISLLGPLMSMIVLPYLGPGAARHELNRPTSEGLEESPASPPLEGEDPLAGLQMRLTYRTLCVLTAIAERPGASNRTVAEASGITDQGQISRLLMRLQRLDLIENSGGVKDKGSPNAWRLTDLGARLERATRQRDQATPR
ncbi:MAG: hypothetical protein QOI89_1110 [Solirubrobacteraceae bacterium]|jgi:AcrR family transcriptional regulator/DNA-binding MarR family transcriptional regulator|nr:hypothetical protein [Solirubrobacteraceae bacterium]MEA2672888.1 hypothetical protein [Chloroflexota bacterium]